MRPEASLSFRSRWGLRRPAEAGARRVEGLWRGPLLLVLVGTIPAFYAELLEGTTPWVAVAAYVLAGVTVLLARVHVAARTLDPAAHLRGNLFDALLALALVIAATLPGSDVSQGALAVRLVVSGGVLLRLVLLLQPLMRRGGLPYLLGLSVAVLALCGAGFWWLEPTVHGFGDGLWLAFTTAATVGYGDIVPTTPAARIFAVFVVLLGFGVLTTVTAAIAAVWVETEERRIEREILHDLRAQMATLHRELAALRAEQRAAAHLLAERREHHRGS